MPTYQKGSNEKNKTLVNTIGIVAIVFVFILAVVILQLIGSSNFSVYKNIDGESSRPITTIFISPEEQKLLDEAKRIKELEAQVKADEESKINVLILGRGWWNHGAPELTDSIILASFHKNKNHISLLSIPRDLFVEYGDYTQWWNPYTGKINGMYVHYLNKYKDESKAVKKLQSKITTITWERIDHYVNIDFAWFVKLIDSLGGVQINVPKTIVDDQYPNSTLGYEKFILRKWDWLLDGKVALKYVRSRKNTWGDFGRSQRQQQVIESLKWKILTGKYLSNPGNIRDLYNIFTEYVSTDIDILTAINIFTEIKSKENTQVYSSWINASCIKSYECQKGWLVYYPQRIFFRWQSVLLPEWAQHNELDSFESIQEYANIVFNLPESFAEKNKISIFSKLSDKEPAEELRQRIKIFWWEINMLEKIGPIGEPETPTNVILVSQNIELEKSQTTESTSKTDNSTEVEVQTTNIVSEKDGTTQEWIDETVGEIKVDITSEYNNVDTKIIINRIDLENPSVIMLKKLMKLTDDNIEIQPWEWPKYARDPDTKIEIIFTS